MNNCKCEHNVYCILDPKKCTLEEDFKNFNYTQEKQRAKIAILEKQITHKK